MEAKLPDGKIILVKPNGTWVYADSNVDIFGSCHKYVKFSETENGFTASVKEKFVSSSFGGVSEIQIHVYKNQDGSAITFWFKGASQCTTKGKEIVFTYDDESETTWINNEDANCDGEAGFIMLSENPLSKVFLQKVVTKIRIYTSHGYVEEILSPENKEILDIILKCIYQ